ncbi:MAG: type II secretion system protein N [Sulfurimicrobium sp.]|nr:type II secretion system protein N [Sulfurimicrobium sp.]MDP2198626.1 type II secretion system protein N [Sulfurimicrobium sp.]MDP3686556.1 type II secretion system protein N [Sulfurimicrobium sp.]MDZ7655429.1 type II secretion system protein N [Sulfurimicrobium sp.]
MTKRLPQKFSAFLQTRWLTLLSLGLVTLLCWQLAHWTWLFLAPTPAKPVAAAPATSDAARLLETIRAGHLFGTASQAGNLAAAQATTSLNLKLSGVFAASGKLPAVAIIDVENKGDLPFVNGDGILPGVTLEQVRPDHVVLNRGGVREKLLLEQKGAPLPLQEKASELNVRQEGKGRFGVSRSELNQALSDPAQLAGAGRVKALAGQGLRIEEANAGGLMNRLGLQGGDIIRQINNKPVDRAADLINAYQASNSISVKGIRNGVPFEYNYTVR